MEKVQRCAWVTEDKLYKAYHDNEWGVPVYDDYILFEFLLLEGFQAGLSWLTILKKRENFRKAFDDFDFNIVAHYSPEKLKQLQEDKGIIRNRLKINSAVSNAQAFLKVREEFGSFSAYIWAFVERKPIMGKYKNHSKIPTSTTLSDKISKDLKKRGFKFVGSTIVYAFMQAVGMVNNHTKDCFKYHKNK